MPWELMNFNFKQCVEGGYRYLDRCGEFMVIAEEQFGFIPGEARPTMAKMEIPEEGISMTVTTTELNLQQDYPTDDGSLFLECCLNAVRLTEDLFHPSGVSSNGFLSRWLARFASSEQAMAASVAVAPDRAREIGEIVGMVPEVVDWNFGYRSGNQKLFVRLESIKLETTIRSLVATAADSPRVKTRVEKFNKKGERLPKNLKHAVALSVDLIEETPPPDSIPPHFAALRGHQTELLERFKIA